MLNSTTCTCPEECDVVSYSPELSLSGLSISSVQPFLNNYENVYLQNAEAQEIENRIDATSFSQTIQQLQDLLISHTLIRSAGHISSYLVMATLKNMALMDLFYCYLFSL